MIEDAAPDAELPRPGSAPVVVAALADTTAANGPQAADLIVDAADARLLADRLGANPVAAITFAVLLRAVEASSVEWGLAVESAVYSMLQGGAEFAAWRGTVDAKPLVEPDPTVLFDRDDDRLDVVLNRPERHNAVTAQLRDELCSVLQIAIADKSIARVVLTGNGPSFCSGGDLAEFGARPDPATAHVARLVRSPARLLHHLADRLEVHVHGHTLGGGIEMAAFAHHVVAAPDATIGLPEVGLGLIPGAGGTVSVPRRIGRHRTAWLGLTGRTIDAATAATWGLVDSVAGPRTWEVSGVTP